MALVCMLEPLDAAHLTAKPHLLLVTIKGKPQERSGRYVDPGGSNTVGIWYGEKETTTEEE